MMSVPGKVGAATASRIGDVGCVALKFVRTLLDVCGVHL